MHHIEHKRCSVTVAGGYATSPETALRVAA
jgi:hypothetical protein